jgi:hypothetical protein
MAFMTLSTSWEENFKKQSWSDFCAECKLPDKFEDDSVNS